MATTVRRAAVLVLLTLCVACGGSSPTSPSGTGQPLSAPPAAPAPPRVPIVFPPLSGPSRSFIFDRELTDQLRSTHPWGNVRDYTRNSRFVLHDNGAFLLQYPPSNFEDGRFTGAYRVANGGIMFLFNSSTGRSVDEAWDDATGTLKGDSLTIEYHEIMQHSDFENAVYVLVP